MPYVSPAAIVTATTISKSTFGDVVKADLDFLANPPACRVYHNANQNVTTAGAGVTLAFNAERYDTNTMHDTATNNSRITINAAGLYLVSFNGSWQANATGVRVLEIWINGATRIANAVFHASSAADMNAASISTVYKFAAADYVTVIAYQTSGVTLSMLTGADYSPEFSATWVGLG